MSIRRFLMSVFYYIVLQAMCVPIMLSIGYDYYTLPMEGTHAFVYFVLQCFTAIIVLAYYWDDRKEK